MSAGSCVDTTSYKHISLQHQFNGQIVQSLFSIKTCQLSGKTAHRQILSLCVVVGVWYDGAVQLLSMSYWSCMIVHNVSCFINTVRHPRDVTRNVVVNVNIYLVALFFFFWGLSCTFLWNIFCIFFSCCLNKACLVWHLVLSFILLLQRNGRTIWFNTGFDTVITVSLLTLYTVHIYCIANGLLGQSF